MSKARKLFVLLVMTAPCNVALGKTPAANVPVVIKWEKRAEWPHDSEAFTQGLELWGEAYFLESIGQYGKSAIRKVHLKTGKVAESVSLEPKFFGEGVTRVNDQIIQLTWKEGVILQWTTNKNIALKTQTLATFKGEGWGLTKGQGSLWVSNGTSEIQELDLKTFRLKRTFKVTLNGQEMDHLNELEFVNGKIYANVWMTSTIVRFSSKTGIIDGLMDLSPLLPPKISQDAVANGIAWNEKTKRLYVTGKLWPKVFELSLLSE